MCNACCAQLIYRRVCAGEQTVLGDGIISMDINNRKIRRHSWCRTRDTRRNDSVSLLNHLLTLIFLTFHFEIITPL